MSEVEKPGYHLAKIEKGVLGEFSKVKEEYLECMDAYHQFCIIMALVEMSDLVGAMRWYYGEEAFEEMAREAIDEFPNVTKHQKYISFQDTFDELEKQPQHKPNVVLFLQSIIGSLGEVNMSFSDLMQMNNITRRAFEAGRRK
jgi:hypothetical protein